MKEVCKNEYLVCHKLLCLFLQEYYAQLVSKDTENAASQFLHLVLKVLFKKCDSLNHP